MSDKYLPEKFSIKPINSEHSKAIQERLFELGYKWWTSGKKIRDYGSFPIFISSDNDMSVDASVRTGATVTLDDLYRLERKPEFKEVLLFDGDVIIKESSVSFRMEGNLTKGAAIVLAKKILEVYGVER